MQALPHLMFQGDLQDALDLWGKAFPDMTIGDGQITLAGQTFSVFDSPPVHDFTFTPSFSIMVRCDTADQVDHLANILSEGGKVMMPLDSYDFAPRFTWIADKFGVSWQIIQTANG